MIKQEVSPPSLLFAILAILKSEVYSFSYGLFFFSLLWPLFWARAAIRRANELRHLAHVSTPRRLAASHAPPWRCLRSAAYACAQDPRPQWYTFSQGHHFVLSLFRRSPSQPASQPANSRKYDLKEIIGIYGSHRPQSTNAGRGWPKEILKRPE